MQIIINSCSMNENDMSVPGGGNRTYETDLSPDSSPFLKKQSVDLTFKNITFEVKTRKWRKPFHPGKYTYKHLKNILNSFMIYCKYFQIIL